VQNDKFLFETGSTRNKNISQNWSKDKNNQGFLNQLLGEGIIKEYNGDLENDKKEIRNIDELMEQYMTALVKVDEKMIAIKGKNVATGIHEITGFKTTGEEIAERYKDRKDIIKMNIFTFNNWVNFFTYKIKKDNPPTKTIVRR
jgi:hypothetical protein